jgi:hypothetical protein
MTRRLMIAAGLLTMVAVAAPVRAHNEYRIIGTVVRVAPGRLDVKQTRDGKVFAMTTDDETVVTRNKAKVALTELAAGLHVVVDACGDNPRDLLVNEVRIVPAPAAK